MTRILGISGSQRAGSFNTALLRAAREVAGGDVEVDTATLHGLVHRLAQVVQQIGLGRARHHEGSVVRCALDVAPGFAGQVELLAKEVDLLLKLLTRAVDRRAGSASDLSHGPPPAPPGHAPAGAPARKPAPSTQ